jgi:predicted aspartyl protease
MKKILLIIWILFIAFLFSKNTPAQLKTKNFPQLEKLYDENRCFELAEEMKDYDERNDPELFFFRGAINNAFFKSQLSNQYLYRYISKTSKNKEKQQREAYSLLADNYQKMYQYRKAGKIYRQIINRFKSKLAVDEINDYANAARINEALSNVKGQSVAVESDSVIKKTNSEKGWKLPITANDFSVDLGIDTGANFSLLAKSLAQKLGVKMIDAQLNVDTINSSSIHPQLGVLPKMKIGNAVIRNIVFLVMDDKNLTFNDGFMLEGVIGFPVIAGLNEITLESNGDIFIPAKPTGAGKERMCLNGLNILFQATVRTQKLIFKLDTGAEVSDLYLPFFTVFEDEVKAKYKLRSVKISGIGGTEEVPAYMVKDFQLELDGKKAQIPEIRLFTKIFGDISRLFYGNIGQDLIKNFDEFTLNFDSMSIRAGGH